WRNTLGKDARAPLPGLFLERFGRAKGDRDLRVSWLLPPAPRRVLVAPGTLDGPPIAVARLDDGGDVVTDALDADGHQEEGMSADGRARRRCLEPQTEDPTRNRGLLRARRGSESPSEKKTNLRGTAAPAQIALVPHQTPEERGGWAQNGMSSSLNSGSGSENDGPGPSERGPPPPPSRGPSIWTRCALTSVVVLLLPSLSFHSRVVREPSMYTWRPFLRYWPQISACFPQTTIRCHSVLSCF